MKLGMAVELFDGREYNYAAWVQAHPDGLVPAGGGDDPVAAAEDGIGRDDDRVAGAVDALRRRAPGAQMSENRRGLRPE